MKSLKAVFAGVFFIIVVTLVLQLVFLLLAVGYNDIAHDYPFLDEIRGYFRYVLGIPMALLIMFVGGYLTAAIAESKALLHSAVTGILSLAVAIVPALDYSSLTLMGSVTLLMAFLLTVVGGWYWQKNNVVPAVPS